MHEPTVASDAYDALTCDPFVQELLKPAYSYYAVHFLCVLLGFCLSGALLVITSAWWVQIGNAVLLAVVLVQAGTLAHDLSHGQVMADREARSVLGSTVWGLMCGVSQQYWYAHHNTHHIHPNRIGYDPDMSLPFYFDVRERATAPRWVQQYYIPVQHLLFFPLIGVSYLFLTVRGYWYLVRTPTWRGAYEGLLILCHFFILFYFLITYLTIPMLLLFLAIHLFAASTYMGLVFAPNHKGMPVHESDTNLTWREQITTTRNLIPTSFNFIVFGGLNFQIEHHLFPQMPRINYYELQPLVKELCQQEGLPYHEVTARQSFGEMYAQLRRVAKS